MGTIPRHAEVAVVVDASPDRSVGGRRRSAPHRRVEPRVPRGAVVDGAAAPALGARFRGRNRVGRNGWTRTCEIVGYDPGREISWRTVPTQLVYRDSTIWTITVEPEGAGTRITQRYEVVKLGPIFDRFIYQFVPVHRDRTEALTNDLQRIGEVAHAPEPRPAG